MKMKQDINELYDLKVQKMARHFDFDYAIVQKCYEQSGVSLVLNDDQYEHNKTERDQLRKYKKSLENAIKAYENLPGILRGIDKLTLQDPVREIRSLINRSLEINDMLKQHFNSSSRAHGKNPYAQAIADWLALIFYKSGKQITIGLDPVTKMLNFAILSMKPLCFVRKDGRPHWRRFAEVARDNLKAKLGVKKVSLPFTNLISF